MAKKRYTPEQIVAKTREAEVELAQICQERIGSEALRAVSNWVSITLAKYGRCP